MASAARIAISTARLLRTGSVPGRPRQTGHTLEFGGSPNRVAQPQKILVLVRSWTWTSKPMTGSYLASSSGDMADSVANFVIGKKKYSRGARGDAWGGILTKNLGRGAGVGFTLRSFGHPHRMPSGRQTSGARLTLIKSRVLLLQTKS